MYICHRLKINENDKQMKKMMKRMCGLLVVCLVVALQAMAAESKSIESWLQQFEKDKGMERLEVANRLMEVYCQEELTDGLVQFDAKIHPDTLNQQIWYWSAEYFYVVQDYQQALACGKRPCLCAKVPMGKPIA